MVKLLLGFTCSLSVKVWFFKFDDISVHYQVVLAISELVNVLQNLGLIKRCLYDLLTLGAPAVLARFARFTFDRQPLRTDWSCFHF